MKIENWHKNIMASLHELADADFQERIWVRGEGPEVSSYVEAVCQLYDDSGLTELLQDKSKPVISLQVDNILRELSSELDGIDSQMSAKDILEHPRWPKIRELADQAWQLMNSL